MDIRLIFILWQIAGKSEADLTRCILRSKVAKICSGVKAAIQHCAAGGGQDVNGLRHDIANTLQHCLGNHQRCRPYFCNTEGGSQGNSQMDNSDVINAAQRLLDNLALNADRLKHGYTSNKAENFFSLKSKLIIGKRENLSNRGNYSLRVLVTILLYNDGFEWSATGCFEEFSGRALGDTFQKYATQRNNQRQYSSRHALKPEAIEKRYAVRIVNDVHYGPGLQTVPTSSMVATKKLEYMVSFTMTSF